MTAVIAAALACLAIGFGQEPPGAPDPLPDGTEVMVSSADGSRLVGYGRVDDARLVLQLAGGQRGDVAIMVVTPAGGFSSYLGRLGATGVLVQQAEGSVPFLRWLADRGVRLVAPSDRASGDRERSDEIDAEDDADEDDVDDDEDDDVDDDDPDDDPDDDDDVDDDLDDDEDDEEG
jgi:hypothetical protein